MHVTGLLFVQNKVYKSHQNMARQSSSSQREHYGFEYRSFPGMIERDPHYILTLKECGTLLVPIQIQKKRCKALGRIVTEETGQRQPSALVVQPMNFVQMPATDGPFKTAIREVTVGASSGLVIGRL